MIVLLFQPDMYLRQQDPQSEDAKDQHGREHISDRLPHAFCRNQQIINGMKHDTGPQDPHRSGDSKLALAEHVCDAVANRNTAQNMNGARRHAANQKKREIPGSVF